MTRRGLRAEGQREGGGRPPPLTRRGTNMCSPCQIPPEWCLPVQIDAGTNNEANLEDECYIGLRQKRESGARYDALIEEFVVECQRRYGEKCLLQFEDFGNSNAFRLLDHYKTRCCCFNDDIQGTAGVVLAGLFAAARVSGVPLREMSFVFLGAGEAGVGIADLIAYAVVDDARAATGGKTAMSLADARKRIFLLDSRGLIVASRADPEKGDPCRGGKPMAHHKLRYAHDHVYRGGLGCGLRLRDLSRVPTALRIHN